MYVLSARAGRNLAELPLSWKPRIGTGQAESQWLAGDPYRDNADMLPRHLQVPPSRRLLPVSMAAMRFSL